MPNFVDMTIDDGARRARRRERPLGQIVWTPFGPNGPPRGRSCGKRPAPAAQIDPFAPVSLQVSAGPTEYGYIVRQVHADR